MNDKIDDICRNMNDQISNIITDIFDLQLVSGNIKTDRFDLPGNMNNQITNKIIIIYLKTIMCIIILLLQLIYQLYYNNYFINYKR